MDNMLYPIAGYPRYAITKDGRVWSYITNKWLKISVNKRNGYGYVCFSNRKIQRGNQIVAVHFLVASEFVPNPSEKKEVNHKDLNKLNNNFENLEWVSRKENARHAVKYGRSGSLNLLADERKKLLEEYNRNPTGKVAEQLSRRRILQWGRRYKIPVVDRPNPYLKNKEALDNLVAELERLWKETGRRGHVKKQRDIKDEFSRAHNIHRSTLTSWLKMRSLYIRKNRPKHSVCLPEHASV